MVLKVLDPVSHGELRLKKNSDFSFARDRIMVPVWGREILQAARSFPVVFMPKDGFWLPLALMGIGKQQNHFVSSSGAWTADYIPAVLRAHPFYTITTSEGETVLGIEEDDPSLTSNPVIEDESLPLFDGDGSPSSLTNAALNILEQLRVQQEHTWLLLNRLEELELLKPWRADGLTQSGVSSKLFSVDEHRLNELDDENFLKLRNEGALALMYSHLLSLKHFGEMYRNQSQLWLAATQRGSSSLFSSGNSLFIFDD